MNRGKLQTRCLRNTNLMLISTEVALVCCLGFNAKIYMYLTPNIIMSILLFAGISFVIILAAMYYIDLQDNGTRIENLTEPISTMAKSTQSASGIITRVIDGNTIIIDDIRIRIPLVDVENSGDTNAPHALFAKSLCPAGSQASYDIDNMQPIDKYGRTIAKINCGGIDLGQALIDKELGWVNEYYCDRSEFENSYC